MLEILSGFVNIRKHSAKWDLEVMDGSKRMAPLFALAASFLASFLCLRCLVRDRSS